MWGRWLKHSSLYPTWLVRLVRKDKVRFFAEGHGEGQTVDGEIGDLSYDLIDENLRGIEDWFARQNRYSTREALYELSGKRHRGLPRSLAGQIPFRGLVYFVYAYVFRLGFLDGRDGFTFCLMKAIYQETISIKKYDRHRLRPPA